MENQSQVIDAKFGAEQQTLFDLKELAVVTTRSIGDLKTDLKNLKSMLKDSYTSNSTYVDNDTQLKNARKNLTAVKKQLESQPEIAQYLDKAKSLREEIKEKKSASSDYALEYNRICGETELQIDGEEYQIIKSAILVRKIM